jgi:pSer/pThr/pTyr-binding forkhead associated (FHA) protein
MNVKLIVVQGRPRGKCLIFPEGEYFIGRGTECHIRPNSEWVSRQHCLLRVAPGGISIRDLSSRNGTLVNGARVVEEQRLQHDDLLQVGPLVLRVLLEDPLGSPAPPTAPPVVEPADTTVACTDTAEMPLTAHQLIHDSPTEEQPLSLKSDESPSPAAAPPE